MGKTENLYPALWELLRLTPKGKVVTYKTVSEVLLLKNPRQVGKYLSQNPSPLKIPCFKVVRNDGSLANYSFGGPQKQKELLEKEGIKISGFKIENFKGHLWEPSFLLKVYLLLLLFFGPPGPWPRYEKEKTLHTPEEIIIGAVLTQSVSWGNVQKVIDRLREKNLNRLEALALLPLSKIIDLIRPARYYQRKAETLKEVSKVILEKGGLERFRELPERRETLLRIRGIGPETADTILLYAFSLPYFVIDEYTKRLLRTLGYPGPFSYNKLQSLFTSQLPEDIKVYQDYHALIIRWGKEREKPRLTLSWPS